MCYLQDAISCFIYLNTSILVIFYELSYTFNSMISVWMVVFIE